MKVWTFLKNVLLNPEEFFKPNLQLSKEPRFDSPFAPFFIFLILWTLVLSGFKVIHDIGDQGIKVKVINEADQKKFQEHIKESRNNLEIFKIISTKALYAAVWLFIPSFFGGIRFLFMKLLGDAKGAALDLISISFATSLPLLITSGIISISFDLFTLFSWGRTQTGLYVLLNLAFIGLFLGWLWEGKTCMQAYKNLYGQNSGRAILTWISPGLLSINLLAIYIMFNGLLR